MNEPTHRQRPLGARIADAMKKHLGKIGAALVGAWFAMACAAFWDPSMFPSWIKLVSMAGVFAGLVLMLVSKTER